MFGALRDCVLPLKQSRHDPPEIMLETFNQEISKNFDEVIAMVFHSIIHLIFGWKQMIHCTLTLFDLTLDHVALTYSKVNAV